MKKLLAALMLTIFMAGISISAEAFASTTSGSPSLAAASGKLALVQRVRRHRRRFRRHERRERRRFRRHERREGRRVRRHERRVRRHRRM